MDLLENINRILTNTFVILFKVKGYGVCKGNVNVTFFMVMVCSVLDNDASQNPYIQPTIFFICILIINVRSLSSQTFPFMGMFDLDEDLIPLMQSPECLLLISIL